MKKVLVTIALLGAAAYTYGQGTVLMGNSSALVSIKTSADATPVVMPASAAPVYRFAAFYGAPTATAVQFAGNWNATVSSLSGWTLLQSGVNNAATPGRISWTAAQPTVPGFAGGSQASFFVAAWQDTGSFGTWDLAKAGAPIAVGSSEYIRVVVGGGATSVPTIWGADQPALDLFASAPIVIQTVVPEPTSFALLGLGAAGLLIFRRRN